MRRYPFAKETYDLEQLRDELLAAELPCAGACGSGDVVEVLLSEAVPDGLARCAAVVEAHVPKSAAQRLREQSVAVLTGTREPDLHSVALLLRMLASDLYTQINDLRERDVRVSGTLPRVLEPTIMARLVAGLGG